MDPESSLESRLRYVEQLAQQLTRQMKMMKQLVTTEVQDLKSSLQQQADDMRSVLIQQDKLYQEQIRRLESRVEQLAEFAMHMAQSKSLAASMGLKSGSEPAALPGITTGAGSPRASGAPPTRSPEAIVPYSQGSPARLGRIDSDDDSPARGGEEDTAIPGVLAKYRGKIAGVYKHYAETASRALHPTMSLPQFTRFTKDCGLCNSSQGGTVAVNAYLPPPELLWMNVLRRLPQQRRKRAGRGGRTGGFAFERVQELSEEQFPDVLVILAEEQYGNAHGHEPAAIVERFLTTDIFPVTDRRIEAAVHQKEADRARRATPLAASSLNDYYDNKEVRDAFKEYRTKLRNAFHTYVTRHHSVYRRSENLTLQGFSDAMRDHGLTPHISQKQIREIFLSVVQGHDAIAAARGGDQAVDAPDEAMNLFKPIWLPRGTTMAQAKVLDDRYKDRGSSVVKSRDGGLGIRVPKSEAPFLEEDIYQDKPEELEFRRAEELRRAELIEIDAKGFHAALRHVAEHVYGDRALVEKFPTPESRLRKLLAKMFLLTHG